MKVSRGIASDFLQNHLIPVEQAVDGRGLVTWVGPACHIDAAEASEDNKRNPRVKNAMFVLLFNFVCILFSCY